ncbi:MAG: hypothetical protein U9Q83_09655, partial [Bacteroidota bacterium]|nr:hypothetical protein [Bacteroidota bacterium]
MNRKFLSIILVMVFFAFSANAQTRADYFNNGQKIHTQGKIVKQNNKIAKGVIMTETFAAGLPSGWQNVDNGSTGFIWTFDNPGARTINTTTFSDGFAIFDSDNNGGGAEDADLITAPIDCSGNTTVRLSFEHYCRSDFGGSGEVFVSG